MHHIMNGEKELFSKKVPELKNKGDEGTFPELEELRGKARYAPRPGTPSATPDCLPREGMNTA